MVADLREGSELAGYRIQALVARGGMGVVYRATQLSLEREVALKLIAPELASQEAFRSRFLREAKLAASLEHPHVLPVYEAGEVDGQLFLALRYVEGADLGSVLARGPLSPETSRRIVAQLCSALGAAHERGLLHRDVKPENVLLLGREGEEHAYLTDFGLAKPQAEHGLTQTDELLGSLAYLAPEQIEKGHSDERSDLYALGCLVYACLTGTPPFVREHEAALLWAHLKEPAPLPSEAHPELGDAFDWVIERALAKDPAERFQSAAELAVALASEAPPTRRRAGSPTKTNLPKPASSFLGRERELEEVGALLRREEVRLLTLTGPGGTGKTRLALQAASEIESLFPDGVYWVPLAPLRDPVLLLPTIAQALEIREQPGTLLGKTLAAALSGKRTLILLDNVEHLLPDAAREVAALEASAGPVLLVTSRERLQLGGEQLYPVPTLEEADGIELFLARARSLEPSFAANGSVAELCARLDNLPLALELAAARTTLFTPAQLLERLSQRLDLLKGGRDVDPRHQTLRATIEWSYDLLTPGEQRLFRSLSAFAGGCTYEAIQEICDADPDTLQSLLDKSLLRRRDDELGARYWMLETIREHAAEQLDSVGEAGELKLRYRRYFLALAEQLEPELWGGQDEAIVRLENENANLRAALGSARAEGDAETALRLAVAIYRFWEVRSRYGEARDWLSQALALDGGNPNLRAKALMGVGRAANLQCDWNEAIVALERSADSFRDLHDRVGISRCLGFLGHAYLFTGDTARAADVLEENLVIARQTADVQTIASALYNLAFAYIERSEFERARELFEGAGRIHNSLRNKYGLALETIMLGHVSTLAGDYERAATELRKGLNAAQEIGSPTWIFIARRYLARLALLEGRTDEAEHLLAVLSRGRLDEIVGWEAAHLLDDLAALAAARGEAPRAARLWGAADAAFEALGLALLEGNRLLRGRFMPQTHESLNQISWHACWTEGHGMGIPEAIAYAHEQESTSASS
jgi:predicted ATPase/tRNA A-37 threonylcarbamoyl transferase component Bud32